MAANGKKRKPVNDNPDNAEVFAILYDAQQRLRALGYSALVDIRRNSVTHRGYVLIAAELRHDVLVSSVALQRGSDIVDIETGYDLAADLVDAALFYDEQT